MNIVKEANQFSQFRLRLYHEHFNKRDDTLMDLVDSVSSNTQARSVVELSLNPCFRRDYNSLFKGLDEYQSDWVHKNLAQLAGPHLPPPHKRPFWLLGVDVTACPRPYAEKLDDRSYVFQPTALQTNKPVTVGHRYSSVFLLPERSDQSFNWVIPLSNRRVVKWEDKERVGADQIRLLLEDATLPFYNQLCVEVADSSYSKPAYLLANRAKSNLISIIRVRSNHVFYRQPQINKVKAGGGHPAWYGALFRLKDASTWPHPDSTLTIDLTSRKKQVYRVELKAWNNLLMRDYRHSSQTLMHRYPLTLVRICYYRKNGETVYAHPLWLIVMGQRRQEIKLADIFTAYNQRYDMEHFFRFGKQRMLLAHYQTSEVRHEENWWQIVHLAYLQLWIAHQYASNQPRPWERYLPELKTKSASPAMVQRSFGAIIRQFGTPAGSPKRRGYSSGRSRDQIPP